MERDLKMQNTLSEEGARGRAAFEGVKGRQEWQGIVIYGIALGSSSFRLLFVVTILHNFDNIAYGHMVKGLVFCKAQK